MHLFPYKPTHRTALTAFAAGLAVWAVICLVAVVRELLRGRRPAWLATWTASAFLSVPKAIQYVALACTGGRAEHLLVRSVIPLALAFSAAILAGIWRVPKWRVPAVVALAVFLFSGTATHNLNMLLWLDLIADAVLSVLFGLAVFAEHRFGSTAHAALFLLAWHSLPVGSSVITDGWERNAYVAAILVIGAIAVVFARQPDWRRKMRMLSIGVLVRVVCYAVQCGLFEVGMVRSATVRSQSLLIVASCVAAPMIYEYYRKARLQAQQTPTATA